MTNPVVVGIDGSTSARRAALWAATHAALHGLPMRLVHAYDLPLVYPQGAVDPEQWQEALLERGRAWLEEARELVGKFAPELTVEVALTRGPAVPALIEESERAATLVVGTRGLGGFTGLLVGSVAVGVSGRAHCPVVVARGHDEDELPPAGGSVVVGVDGTPTGEPAIGFAFAEASRRGAPLVAVHAWTDTALDAVLASGSTVWDFAPATLHAEEVLAERLAGWQEQYPDVWVSREIVRGRPSHALLEQAKTAAVVVVGSRGRGGFTGLILGSTSQHLLHHAPGPVAVVRTAGSEQG